MTPTRLPRPGQVEERCRLCGAVLQVSLENPRRVCGACGEVNLPSDHVGPGGGAISRAEVRGPPKIPTKEPLRETPMLWMSGVPVASTFIAFFLYGRFSRNALDIWLGTMPKAVVASVILSALAGLLMMWRRRMNPGAAVMFWGLGVFGGVLAGAVLSGLLFLFVAYIPWLLR